MVLSRKQGLSFKHLGEDAAGAPDVNFDVILLPGEHNLRGSIVSGRDIARHLRILDARQAKVANFQIAVLVHQNVTGLQIAMDDTSGMDIFEPALNRCQLRVNFPYQRETHHDLIEEILNELLLQGARSKQPVQISPE